MDDDDDDEFASLIHCVQESVSCYMARVHETCHATYNQFQLTLSYATLYKEELHYTGWSRFHASSTNKIAS